MSIEGRILGEFEHEQLELARKLVQASKSLSHCFPEGNQWHAVSPEFDKPVISLRGHNVSAQLLELGRRSTDFHVNFRTSTGDESLAPYSFWQVYPLRGASFIGRFVSQCHGDKNLAGLGMTLFLPGDTTDLSPITIEKLREDGTLNLDLLFWFEGGEQMYDRTKPESICINMIENDPTASLEFALWMLEGLKTVRNIHPEEELFQI